MVAAEILIRALPCTSAGTGTGFRLKLPERSERTRARCVDGIAVDILDEVVFC